MKSFDFIVVFMLLRMTLVILMKKELNAVPGAIHTKNDNHNNKYPPSAPAVHSHKDFDKRIGKYTTLLLLRAKISHMFG